MNWKLFKVATDFSHHQLGGRAVYKERFDRVMKFHPPGLAPVVKAGKAWHIHPDGTSPYPERYTEAFGYYENYAAVTDENGTFHICPDGSPLYRNRYQWAGNFQESRCTVRTKTGLYHHIDSNGERVGAKLWKYAGDYRDGVAVVQREDGLSTHVDENGDFVHGHWFLDLDIFHKGYARAKDINGWFHIDASGNPIYEGRYTMIEPYYNGQARVETNQGALLVIDEKGMELHRLRDERNAFHELSEDLVGFWRTHTIATAVGLGLFELLPAKMDILSETLGVPEKNCERFLKALWDLNLCKPLKDGTWNITAKGEFLQKRNKCSLATASIEYAKYLEPRWLGLREELQGQDYISKNNIFSDVCEDENRTIDHHNMLSSYAENDYPPLIPIMPVKNGQSILDVGGSNGVLAMYMKTSFPNSKVTVLDLPAVIKTAPVQAGINYRSADFFKEWQIAAEIVMMSRIMHDWNDNDASKILNNAREAILPGGKLLIIEMVLDDDIANGHLCDIHLMAVTGGQERTLKQYKQLFFANGFRIETVHNNGSFLSVIEAVPYE